VTARASRAIAFWATVMLTFPPVGAGAQHGAGTPHHQHAPPGWKFTLPQGDPAKGRAVFVKLQCYACHEVRGQTFPGAKAAASIGPELSEMAAHHEAEFFAEAIVNPNALIDEPQWRAPDGTSRMPSFNDLLTVQELVDLVAFLKSLKPPAAGGGHRH
jgi:mono/diheme cytochrome c family protein